MSKERQITRKKFSKRRNAVSESEVSHLDALYKLKDTVNKNHPVHDQLYFSDSKATSHSSKQGKKRIKRYTKINQYVYTDGTNQSDTLNITH